MFGKSDLSSSLIFEEFVPSAFGTTWSRREDTVVVIWCVCKIRCRPSCRSSDDGNRMQYNNVQAEVAFQQMTQLLRYSSSHTSRIWCPHQCIILTVGDVVHVLLLRKLISNPPEKTPPLRGTVPRHPKRVSVDFDQLSVQLPFHIWSKANRQIAKITMANIYRLH